MNMHFLDILKSANIRAKIHGNVVPLLEIYATKIQQMSCSKFYNPVTLCYIGKWGANVHGSYFQTVIPV